MAKIKVYTRETVNGKRRYVPAVYTGNHKLKPIPGANYFLRYSVGKKRVWQLVGDAALVPGALRDLQHKLAGGTLTTKLSQPVPPPTSSLASSIRTYLAYIQSNKSRKTYLAYQVTLRLFQSNANVPPHQIMKALRHSSLEVTLRYLDGQQTEEVKEKIDIAFKPVATTFSQPKITVSDKPKSMERRGNYR